MTGQTIIQFNKIIELASDIFKRKTKDYGTAWRALRLPSITDQIFIKAKRIRSIQDKGTQKIEDSIDHEFIGIINYCLIALMQSELGIPALSPGTEKINGNELELSQDQLNKLYKKHFTKTRELLLKKDHDYDEAWKDIRVSSITDIILVKLLRIKQIEDNKGKTIVSEGIESNYQDIINYAVFALIKLKKV